VIHKPTLGPYTPDNPKRCQRCGKTLPTGAVLTERCAGLDRTLYALPDWCDHTVLANMQAIRQAGGVARYHTEPLIPPQTNAQHSWNVAMLARALWSDDTTLTLAALLHDTGEVRGDLPAPSKWISPAMKAASNDVEHDARVALGTQLTLTDEQQYRLKLVDYLEACWYCTELRLAGNQFATVIFRRLETPLLKSLNDGRAPEQAINWYCALARIHRGEP
jgi:hypothetical protein